MTTDSYEIFERYCIMVENNISKEEALNELELQATEELFNWLKEKVN